MLENRRRAIVAATLACALAGLAAGAFGAEPAAAAASAAPRPSTPDLRARAEAGEASAQYYLARR